MLASQMESTSESCLSVTLTFLFLDDPPQMLWSAEQRRRLLDPLPDSLSNSPGFCSENGPLPVMELEKEIELGKQ